MKTYEVADLGTLYCGVGANGAYNKDFDVKGITADGVKVKVTDYTVTATGIDNGDLTQLIANSGVKKITAADLVTKTGIPALEEHTLTNKDTAEISLTFTFKDGQKIEKKVTLSKETPVVKSVKIKDDKDVLSIAAISGGLSEAINTAEETFAKTEAAVAAVKANIESMTLTGLGLTAAATEAQAQTAVEDAINVEDNPTKYGTGKLANVILDAKDADLSGDATGQDALDKVKAECIKYLKESSSEYATDKQAIQDAKDAAAAKKVNIYNAINQTIEAKDQYGVNIAESENPNVTVTTAKDTTDNDLRYTYLEKNGTNDAAFTKWGTNYKAEITITFAGGVVFTAKAVGVAALNAATTGITVAAVDYNGVSQAAAYTTLKAKITNDSDKAKLTKIIVEKSSGETVLDATDDLNQITLAKNDYIIYVFSTGERVKVQVGA